MTKTRSTTTDENVLISFKTLEQLIQKCVSEETMKLHVEIKHLKTEVLCLKDAIYALTTKLKTNSNIANNDSDANLLNKFVDSTEKVISKEPRTAGTTSKKGTEQQKKANINKEVAAKTAYKTSENTLVEKKDVNEWTVVNKTKRNKKTVKDNMITGTCQHENASLIKAAPKKAYLYVTRLEKNTKADTLQNYLKSTFPEVECLRLENKFNSNHERFKVTINFDNLQESLNSAIWPMGTQVSRFFHPRRTLNPIS